MTEREAGSDVKANTTRAVRVADEFVINGAKTFITNGSQADVLLDAVKTGAADDSRGLSVIRGELRRAGRPQRRAQRCRRPE